MHVDPRMLMLAGRQRGLAARGQLLDLGLSPSQIHRLAKSGLLLRVETAVFALAGQPWDFDAQILAPILACSGLAAASHGSAARLHGLRGFERNRALHVSVTRTQDPRFSTAATHRSTIFAEVDVCSIDGIPTVRVERAIVTAAAERPRAAGALIDSAVLLGLTTIERLWRYLGRYSGPGCPGSGPVRAALLRRAPLQPPTESSLEDAWIAALEARGITGWVRQHPVKTAEGTVRIDLARPAELLALEVDSRLWHSSEADYQRERRKRYLLAKAGYLVYPVTEFDLDERVDEVAADLRHAARRAA